MITVFMLTALSTAARTGLSTVVVLTFRLRSMSKQAAVPIPVRYFFIRGFIRLILRIINIEQDYWLYYSNQLIVGPCSLKPLQAPLRMKN